MAATLDPPTAEGIMVADEAKVENTEAQEAKEDLTREE